MNRATTKIVRQEKARHTLPRAIADRMKATPARRGEAENMLQDIAFVLSLTRRVKNEILGENA